MTDTAESLDPLRLPLRGERLIEASAGTGKTFTIAALYLRLLLGLGGESAYSRAISVEELLVVTFTEAATEELRGRIRSNIHELRIACLRGESDNPLYSALLAEIDDKDDAAKTLLLAERQMDEAAVFTIHGFCQRMLSLNAFESGTPSAIDSELIKKIVFKIKELERNSFVQEVTIEVNPGTVTQQKLNDYIEAGINRLSIGLQSTNDNLLRLIGRIHTYQEFLKTYEMAVNTGFKNINVDLMIGLPNQTIGDIKESIDKITSLNPMPQHISAALSRR